MGLIFWKIMSPSPEPLSPSSKNNEFHTENAWVVCNQADTESEDRLQTSLSHFTEIDI